ncbi:MAG: hypothetical protein HZB22_06820 [Deltaproteobacteria bacterium]|nr:hypothetical protein [Deltaproteobacteria bacterium]
MEKKIRIRITPDGKVEIDSSVFKDCKDVAEHLTKALGKIESYIEKDELHDKVMLKIDLD